ncbi:MAG: FecR family protein [Sphingobacterium sp.]
MKDSKHIQQLFERYINNQTSKEETAFLLTYLQDKENKEVVEKLIENRFDGATTDHKIVEKEILDRVFNKIILDAPATKPQRPLWHKIVAISAVAALILIISFPLLNWKKDNLSAMQIVPPGSNKATLTISSGETFVLENQPNGQLTADKGMRIEKTSEGGINYSSVNELAQKQPSMHLLNIPKGGQFQLTLSDGTKVWLNSHSSLEYPSCFTGKERRVKLTGEGYFEVAKNNGKSFIVETANQQVEVLGTKFNINAYEDESSTRTTLAEGAVSVNTGQRSTLLKPGQQSILTSNNITVKSVDTYQALDWKNGDFNFVNDDLKSIMRKISRWYNIEVVLEEPISKETYVAQISRKKQLNDLLKALQRAGSFKYHIQNNKLYISQ